MKDKINEKLSKDVMRSFLYLSFFTYFVILVWLIIFKFAIPDLVDCALRNLEEGLTLREILFVGMIDDTFIRVGDSIINLIIFIPLGMYLPLIFRKYNFKRDILIAFLVTLTFEVIEWLLRIGSFDIRDILANVSGFALGSLIYYYLKPITSNKVINIIQIFVVVLFLSVAIYAPISIARNWDSYAPFFDFEKYPYVF